MCSVFTQHPPHNHTRLLQFTTRTEHRFLRNAKKTRFFWHATSCTFSFTKALRCLKLLIPASNSVGGWVGTVELSPECLMNRNNWFTLHKFQHTKRIQLRSRHCRFYMSQPERGVGVRMRTIWITAVSFHVGNLTSSCVLKAVMADWNRSSHFDIRHSLK